MVVLMLVLVVVMMVILVLVLVLVMIVVMIVGMFASLKTRDLSPLVGDAWSKRSVEGRSARCSRVSSRPHEHKAGGSCLTINRSELAPFTVLPLQKLCHSNSKFCVPKNVGAFYH